MTGNHFVLALFQFVLDWRRLLVHSASLPPTRSVRGEIGHDAEIQGVFKVKSRSHALRSSASTFAGTRFGLLISVQRVFSISNLLFRSLKNTENESSTASCANCRCARDSHWSAFSSTRRPVVPCSTFEANRLVYVVVWGQTSPHRCRRGMSQSDIHIPHRSLGMFSTELISAFHSCLRCFSPSSLSSLQITGTRSLSWFVPPNAWFVCMSYGPMANQDLCILLASLDMKWSLQELWSLCRSSGAAKSWGTNRKKSEELGNSNIHSIHFIPKPSSCAEAVADTKRNYCICFCSGHRTSGNERHGIGARLQESWSAAAFPPVQSQHGNAPEAQQEEWAMGDTKYGNMVLLESCGNKFG